ncbi:MAG: rhodanese-like domain-containing protein [Burkholderiales bacterium]
MKFVLDNIHWIAAALISGGMLLWPLVRRAGGPWVSTLEATQLMNREDALVIDVRDADAYAKGHILGAKSVPLVDLVRRASDLAKHKSKAVIVSCQNGDRSAGAAATLRQQGFSRVHPLNGGFAAWQQAGLPVEK